MVRGGYINYYYGYVLVGTPVKLLGIVPSISYNLILPTLFVCDRRARHRLNLWIRCGIRQTRSRTAQPDPPITWIRVLFPAWRDH
jgi:hypothetical protein